MKVIFSFGDSITYGCWGQNTHGWTSLLRSRLDSAGEFPAYYYYALGIPGETSKGLADRFASEVAARRRSDDDGYTFLLACGANDATWLNGDARFKQSIAEYADNMSSIIGAAKKVGGEIILLNTTPVNEEYSREFKGKDKSCLNEYVDKYNLELVEVARSTNVRVVDVNRAFKDRDVATLLIDDGLHPNDDGHKLIFETVKTELRL